MTKTLDDIKNFSNNQINESNKILIRCDGSSHLGMGHVTRCIALAQALVEVGQVPIFVCAPKVGNGIKRINELGFIVHKVVADNLIGDANFTLALARDLGVTNIVVDMCNSENIASRNDFIKFFYKLADSAFNIVVIEGMNKECISLKTPLPVEAVVIPYFGAENFNYKISASCHLFAGEKFFPLRKEFHHFFENNRLISDKATNLLVAIGGGDVSNYNIKILDAIELFADAQLKVKVIGGLKNVKNIPFSVENIPYTSEMPSLISWADCAVIGSGLTRYETAFLGTPSVVFSINSEHDKMVSNFALTGAAVSGGIISKTLPAVMAKTISEVLHSKSARSKMATTGPKIIDGKGAKRLALKLKDFL